MTAVLLFRDKFPRSALAFALSGAVYLCLGLVLTVTVNVPMNEALATVSAPDDIASARALWNDYSHPWQFWNQICTLASGAAFLLAAALQRDGAPFATRPAPPPPLTSNSDPRIYDGFGPLLTGLMGTRSGKGRVFWMGAQPATNLSPSHDLQEIVVCFAPVEYRPA